MANSDQSDIVWMVGLEFGAAVVKVPNRGRLYDVEAVVKELRENYPALADTPLRSVVPILTPGGEPK